MLCTDFDGTLAVSAHVVEKNKAAIEYFKQNGGLFSIITGRSVQFLKERENEVACNTYIGGVNGTIIYDVPNSKVICEEFIAGDIIDRLKQVRKRIYNIKDILIFNRNGSIVIHSSTDDFDTQLKDAFRVPVYKFLIHGLQPFTEEECAQTSAIVGDGYELSRSWASGIEGQNRGVNKGATARKIAELTGARLLVCVGDYENDISMIKQADIGYAVENAIPSLKEAADRVTVSVHEGAIAAVIEDIERDLSARKIEVEL